MVSIKHLSIEEYASYSIAFFGVPGILQIFDSIGQVILIKLVEAINKNDKESVLNIFRQFALKTFSFTIPIVIIVCYYSKEIITLLFTDKYLDAIPLFQLYLSSFIFGMFGAGILLRASGKTKQSLYAYIMTALIVIPLTYILIPKYGVYGAMTSALLGTLLPRLFMMIMEIHIFNFKISEYIPLKNLIQIVSISILTIVPLYIIDIYFSYNIFMSGVYAIIYLIIVFVWEIKLNLFVINSQFIKLKINTYFQFNKFLKTY